MPDMYLDVDAAVTVPVNVLALLDDTDFKTIEEAVAWNAAGMDLNWNFVTSAGVVTQTNVTPTTGGVYDWSHVGNGIYKIEIPASGGGSINNDTEGYGWFSGVATGVLPWCGPRIGFRAAGLNNLLCDSAYSATRGLSGTALPAAAADAAGGLPISDAGGLPMDDIPQGKTGYTLTNLSDANAAKLEDILDGTGGTGLTLSSLVISGSAAAGVVNIDNSGGPGIRVNGTTYGMQCIASTGSGFQIQGLSYGLEAIATAGSGLKALGTNWGIWAQASAGSGVRFVSAGGNGDGLTLDGNGTGKGINATEINAIKAVTDVLPDAGALTTIAADAARLTAARAAVLTDWIDGGRLDGLLDAIPTTAMRGTDSAALASVCTEARLAVLAALTSAGATKLAASLLGIETGVAEAGTLSTTQMTTDLAEVTADHYIGGVIVWTSGVLLKQRTDITDYDGANGLLTFTAVTEPPSAGDTFVIL